MASLHKKGTPHSEEVISKILQLFDDGMRLKDLAKQSKVLIGYKIQGSTICNILKRSGRDASENTFRVRKQWRKYKNKVVDGVITESDYHKNKREQKKLDESGFIGDEGTPE